MASDSFTENTIRTLNRLGFGRWKHGVGVPDGHKGLGKVNTLTKKILLLARWLISLVFYFRERRVALSPLTKIKSKKTAASRQKCLILGSGIIDDASLQKIQEVSLDPNVTIIVMNHFDQSQFFASIRIDFWLMLDRGAQQDSTNDKTAGTWEAIRSLEECTVVVPWQDFKTTKHEKKLAVENHSLAGVTKNISPLWPRGYEGKSCLKAICLADYLGFEEILVAGCSNDYYKHATVTNGYVDADEVKEFAPMSAEDYFQNIANEFAYQRMVLSKIKSKVKFLS